VRYLEKIQSKNRSFEKTFFLCEWWLNIGIATPKKSCNGYLKPFGGTEWEEFTILFGLQDELAEPIDEYAKKNEEELLKDLEFMQQSQQLYKLKEEQIKRRLGLSSEPTPQKKIKPNPPMSNLKRAIMAGEIRGDFKEGVLVNEEEDKITVVPSIKEIKKFFKETDLQPEKERFLERSSKKGSIKEEKMEQKKTLLFKKKHLDEEDDEQILNMDDEEHY
jgi:hypothetical protein